VEGWWNRYSCDVSYNRARSIREDSPLDLLWVGVWATCVSENCTKTLSTRKKVDGMDYKNQC